MLKKRKVFPVFQLFALAVTTVSTQSVHADDSSHWNFSNAQFGAIYITQGGGYNFSGIGKYRPGYDFDVNDRKLGVSLDLGLSGFENAGASSFVMIQYGVLGTYSVMSQWDLGLSVGGQTWTAGNGTAVYVGPEVTYHLPQKVFSALDGIFVAYNAVFQSKFANVIELGLNFKF